MSSKIANRLAHKVLTIDVDIEENNWEEFYSLAKATLQYSFIRRRIYKSNHGYHIYLDIDLTDKDFWQFIALKSVFGDDPSRIYWEEVLRSTNIRLNVLFNSTENYEVKKLW